MFSFLWGAVLSWLHDSRFILLILNLTHISAPSILPLLSFSSLSSDGEKEEGDESLDLRRTESDSVLKKVCVFVCVYIQYVYLQCIIYESILFPDPLYVSFLSMNKHEAEMFQS